MERLRYEIARLYSHYEDRLASSNTLHSEIDEYVAQAIIVLERERQRAHSEVTLCIEAEVKHLKDHILQMEEEIFKLENNVEVEIFKLEVEIKKFVVNYDFLYIEQSPIMIELAEEKLWKLMHTSCPLVSVIPNIVNPTDCDIARVGSDVFAFVSDCGNCVNQYFASTGAFQCKYFVPEMDKPAGVVFHKDMLFVATLRAIFVIDILSGNLLRKLGEGLLTSPAGLCVVERSDTAQLYVTEHRGSRLVIFEISTMTTSTAGDSSVLSRVLDSGGGQGIWTDQLDCPLNMAYFPPNNVVQEAHLYIADSNNHRVQVLDTVTYQFVGSIGAGYGNDMGSFSCPVGVAVSAKDQDSTPYLFVAEDYARRIQIFDLTTRAPVYCIGAPGCFHATKELIFCPANVLVHEHNDDQVVLFVPDKNSLCMLKICVLVENFAN